MHKGFCAQRSLGCALIAMLLAGGVALAAAGSAPAGRGSAGPSPAIKADRDGDKVFDDLEAGLRARDGSERLDVIVRVAGGATTARVQRLEAAVGDIAVSDRFEIVDAFAAAMTRGQVEALSRRGDVLSIEENAVVRAANSSAQSAFGVAKARVDAPGLDGDADGNPSSYGPQDLVAAVIDSGIATSHVDLDGGKVLAFKDFVAGRTEPYDDNGHGTHVAATIAGDGEARADRAERGVAPGAALVGVKVLDSSGLGDVAGIVAAIDWVVANKDVYGIEVINLSLGGSGCSDGTDVGSLAVDRAVAAGLVVAVAAGNEGPGTCTVGSPGAAVHALTVGAMADTGAGGFGLASFSSRGPTADGRNKPDVVGPGVGVTSADAFTTSGYASSDGTSMATPFVAGVALLMREANPALTPAAVKDILRGTAIDWGRGGDGRTAGSTGADIDYGAGRLDAYAALTAAGVTLGTPPAMPRHDLREGTLSGTGARVDYSLSVTDTSVPIAATLIIPAITGASAGSPDFDLFLYGPTGALLARAETIDRQETISYRPTTTGTYTLRVYSYAGSGGYFVDISAGLFVDTTPPTVTGVAPADGAAGVAAGASVSATFNEAMSAASVQAAFTLRRTDTGAGVAGTFSWSGTTMTFVPSAALGAGVLYEATIAAGAQDVAGNRLVLPRTWAFRVATAPTTVAVWPTGTTLLAGSVRSGDATRLAADDNLYYQVNSTTYGTRAADWYARVPGVPNALTALSVAYTGKSSVSCTQALSLYNWTTGWWRQLDSRTVGTTEVSVAPVATGTLADYVSGTSGNGDVRVRVRCSRSDGTSFFVSGDLLRITVTR